MLAGLQKIQRLKEHPAKPLQVDKNFTMLGIIIERQLGRIAKRRIEIQLESDLDHMTGTGLHIERVVIKTDSARHAPYRAGLVRWERLVRDSIASPLHHTPFRMLPCHDKPGTRRYDQADARHARVHTTAARSAHLSASAWSQPSRRTRDRPCRNRCRLHGRQIPHGGWSSCAR